MRALFPVEHPVGRPRARWVLDLGVALAAFAADVPFLFQGDRSPSGIAIAILGLLAAVVVLRRVWPVPVLVLIVVATLAIAAGGVEVRPGVTMLIATYTVASLCPLRIAIAAAAAAGVGLMAVTDTQDGILTRVLLVSGLVVAAAGLGLYTATRRAYLEQLQVRARQLELQRDQQAELAAAAERARIAREMHDIVAHHLTVMVALSDGAAAAMSSSPARAAEAVRMVSATGRNALADTRRVLGVLRDPGLRTADDPADRQPSPDLSSLPALLDQVRAAGLPTVLEVRGRATDIASGIQAAAYRLVQESLTNTMKHGGPGARAEVHVQWTPDALQLEVVDTGRGENARPSDGAGGGLIGMRERVRAFGGTFRAGPRQPAGWTVSALLPLVDDTVISPGPAVPAIDARPQRDHRDPGCP